MFFSVVISFIIIGVVTTRIYSLPSRNPVNMSYVLYSIVVAGLLFFGLVRYLPMGDLDMMYAMAKLNSVFSFSLGFFFLNFTYNFLGKKRDVIYFSDLIITAIASVIVLATPWVVEREMIKHGTQYVNAGGILSFPFYMLFVVCPFVYSLVLFFIRILQTKDCKERASIKVFLIGSSILFGMSVASNFLPMYLEWLSPVSPAIQAVFTFYAVKKFNLFLLGAEEVAQNLFSNSPGGIIIADEEGYITDINSYALSIFGKTKNEMFWKKLSDILPDYDGKAEYVSREVNLERLGRMFLLSQSIIKRDGFEVGKILILNDITELHKIQEEYKESEKKYRTLVENLQEGLFVIRDGKFVYLNDAVTAIVGYETGELLGADFLSVIAPESRGLVAENYRKRISGEPAPSEYEAALICKDQQTRVHVIISVGLIKFEGKPASIGTVKDITERKKSEEALIRRDNFLGAVSLAVHELIADEDLEAAVSASLATLGKYLKVNRAYVFQNGTDAQGEPCTSQRYEWTDGTVHAQLGNEEFTNIPYSSIGRWYDRLSRGEIIDGETKDFPEHERRFLEPQSILSLLVVPIFTREKFWGFVGFDDCACIRKWDESEKAIFRAFSATLGEVIVRKEGEIALKLAKEEAESATRAKSEFLANMSHEIRTPLNAITGMAALAMNQQLTPKLRDYLEIIDSSSKALLGLINDILDFSKIEAGKLIIENTDFQIQEILDQVSDMFRTKAAEKDIELVIASDQRVPRTLVGDPLRLSQILINFVSNAVKFTEKGEILVKVECRGVTDDNAHLDFVVQDTGIGISDDKIEKLFESFRQLDGSTTRKYGGTGLGLAISKSLSELMGGEIHVVSTPGKGSSFSLSVTLGVSKIANERKKVIPVDLSNLRVLIVDDNEAARMVLTEILESFGFRVHAESSGEAALETLGSAYAEGDAFKLVLMDWKMPGMDGIEASKMIRKDPVCGNPKIILMTAFGTAHNFEQDAADYIDGFLLKPTKQSALFDAIIGLFSADQAEAGESMKEVLTKETLNKKALKGAYLLLVEDNKVNQKVAVELLQDAGIRVDVASSGLEGIEMLKKHEYDGVLMDIQMPGIDGYDAARMIRKKEEWKSVPIIAMTANAMKGDREKCLAAGMNDYVSKPIDVHQLYATLRKWVFPKPEVAKAPGGGTGEEEKEIGLPEGIFGINMEWALERLAGKKSLYVSLLRDFVKDNKNSIDEIQDALRTDKEKAERIAHTLKGLAGNIGALGLFEAAKSLEKAIREDEEANITQFLKETAVLLGEVIQSITLALFQNEERGEEGGAGAFEMWTFASRLHTLYGLIRENDLEAVDVAESLGADVKGTEYEEFVGRLQEKLSGFNFREAETVIELLAEKLNLAL